MPCFTGARFLLAFSIVSSLGTAAVVEQKANQPGPSPKSLQATPLTPEAMISMFKQERQQAEYLAAVRTARQVLVANGCSSKYAEITGRAAVNSRLPARMVAALVFVESSCRADAVSEKGAVGLVQVNPRVWRYSRRALQDPSTNLQIGTESWLAIFEHTEYGKGCTGTTVLATRATTIASECCRLRTVDRFQSMRRARSETVSEREASSSEAFPLEFSSAKGTEAMIFVPVPGFDSM